MDTDVPDKKSTPTWTPIFQGYQFRRGYQIPKDISSSMNTEFQRISVPAWIPNPIGNSSDLDTESIENQFYRFPRKSVPV
ncbi:uncharacterized protein OCT59_008430 [Rhizophagus irregularis]|uniref:uncharacterized protein n=1 Tax=Rhizophagus irregularis TaxID=588596 RepID=UPI00332EB28B|nr:hypothetical protein OCT59_008430 [Rhizophagus irregularis]